MYQEVWTPCHESYQFTHYRQYLPGELFSHLRRAERFEQSLYQFYAVEVACALHHLQTLNIVIRDLKPENILIHRSGHIRIADLSFAKIVTDRYCLLVLN